MKQMENEMNVNVPLEVIKASEIEPKEVKWLWYPYIPYGKVTLLQGDPGDGKSKLMLSIAALLSKGEPLPFTETEENEPSLYAGTSETPPRLQRTLYPQQGTPGADSGNHPGCQHLCHLRPRRFSGEGTLRLPAAPGGSRQGNQAEAE